MPQSRLHSLLVIVLTTLAFYMSTTAASEQTEPTAMIVMLIRNKEPYLPYTLTQLSELDYPKKKLSLWLRSDHNEDRSLQLVELWLREYGDEYHDVDAVLNSTSPERRADETSAVDLSDSRYTAMIAMKEEALLKARRLEVDFVWFLDADVFLYDKSILRKLIELGKPLVAPMLESNGRYSNFWAGMSDSFYYQRTDRYNVIYDRKEKDCFGVPMIHSCVLLDLRNKLSKSLTFVKSKLTTPIGPDVDDIITFALSAQQAVLEMYVCNQEEHGQVPIPLEPPEELYAEWENVARIRLKALTKMPQLPVAEVLRAFLPPLLEKTTLGFDNIYIISLQRRLFRRKRVTTVFDELGIKAEIINAIDGQRLSATILKANNMAMLPGYRDPILKRPLTHGEVGCFLSHYSIWKDMLQNGYLRAIVFEDDAHPPLDFEVKLAEAVDDLERLHPDWDLLYLYRETHFLKPGEDTSEPVEGSDRLVRPGYSYSSMAYALSRRGAMKLIKEKPLQKMIPVDEFLSIMFGQHPNKKWSQQFPGSGSLKAFAIHPRIVEPYIYRSDGAITDTDRSEIISDWDNDEEQSCSADPSLQNVCE